MARLVGVDIGGTFTDLVFLDEDQSHFRTEKIASTPEDASCALIDGIAALEVPCASVDLLMHATTVATNAVLERKGCACGLIATRGFRDILELRRRDRPHAYGLHGSFEPLIPRFRRLEVTERISAEGDPLTPLAQEEVIEAAERLMDAGVEAIVISFMNSYRNAAHEQRAKQIILQRWPNHFVVCSAEVLPLFREFERTSTAVINAYVQPIVAGYLDKLRTRLHENEYRNDILMLQSNGSVMESRDAARFPVKTVLSGPAAGVIAATRIAAESGFDQLVSYDMGGTSLDVALVTGGRPEVSSGAELDFGLPVLVSMLDVQTLGAGGGSIAKIDPLGLLQIGPESAGADPGPVCYHRGGSQPTVTDALVMLGAINAQHPIDARSGRRLDRDRARAVIDQVIAGPLGLDPEQAAEAIRTVAINRIAGSLRRLTINRGHDPRDFALFAFGGAGPLFVCPLLRELEIHRAIVPYYPGILSAWGTLCADAQHDYATMTNCRLPELNLKEIETILADHAAHGRDRIEQSGIAVGHVTVIREAEMSFEGQTHVIRVTLPAGGLSHDEIDRCFRQAYARRYGAADESFGTVDETVGDTPVYVLNVRTSVVGARNIDPLDTFLSPPQTSLRDATVGTRDVFEREGFVPYRIFNRTKIPWESDIEGPAVVEQDDTTVWIETGFHARANERGNLLIEPS